MRFLFCFAGLPGVGKTTISQALSQRTGGSVVDIDDFKRSHVDEKLVSSQIDPPELRRQYYQAALEHTFRLFESGVSVVIMDEVFHLHTLRQELEVACESRQIRIVWVEVRCSYEVVEARLRSGSREGHILSTQEALDMYLLFSQIFEDWPTDTDNHIVLENTRSIREDYLVDNILEKAECL